MPDTPRDDPPTPDIIVVMGVSGSGKTTIATGIATALGWEFAEGDDFHPPANVARMRSGQPLTDDDRWPWLERIGTWISARLAAGESAVLTCSALRRAYRDVLRRDRPQVRFLHVEAPGAVIAERVVHRSGHYMPPSLLPSQLTALEPLAPDEPGVTVTTEGGDPAEVRDRCLAALGLRAG